MIVACSAEPKNGPIESSSGINFPKSDLDTSPSNSNPDSTDIDGSVINKKSDDAHSGIPDVPILPNLKPGWLWDTDGPIILSTKAEICLGGGDVKYDTDYNKIPNFRTAKLCPNFSDILAISFIKLTFVANIALAAYFVNSADNISIHIILS